MKDKIIYFIIGALVGAIITTGCFLIFGKNDRKMGDRPDRGQMQQMDGNFTPGERKNQSGSDFKNRNNDKNINSSNNENSNIEKPSNPLDENVSQGQPTGTSSNS